MSVEMYDFTRHQVYPYSVKLRAFSFLRIIARSWPKVTIVPLRTLYGVRQSHIGQTDTMGPLISVDQSMRFDRIVFRSFVREFNFS